MTWPRHRRLRARRCSTQLTTPQRGALYLYTCYNDAKKCLIDPSMVVLRRCVFQFSSLFPRWHSDAVDLAGVCTSHRPFTEHLRGCRHAFTIQGASLLPAINFSLCYLTHSLDYVYDEFIRRVPRLSAPTRNAPPLTAPFLPSRTTRFLEYRSTSFRHGDDGNGTRCTFPPYRALQYLLGLCHHTRNVNRSAIETLVTCPSSAARLTCSSLVRQNVRPVPALLAQIKTGVFCSPSCGRLMKKRCRYGPLKLTIVRYALRPAPSNPPVQRP